MRCRGCGHSGDAHTKSPANPLGDCVVCGCMRFKVRAPQAREARLRTWVVSAQFFVKNRWIAAEVRVKAMGHAGAAMKAVREAKRLALKPGSRVSQVRVTLIPVPRQRMPPSERR
jgi:hypothetical protein